MISVLWDMTYLLPRRTPMRIRYLTAIAFSLLAATPASAQVVRGVMTVTGAEMH